MMDGKDQVEAFMTAIEALGYTISGDMFDFESVPTSKMDKVYRIEINTDRIEDVSGRRVNKYKTLEVWLAYKMTAMGNRKSAFLTMLGYIDAAEDALLQAISLPSEVSAGVISKYVQNFIVVHLTVPFFYWRDLT